MSPRSLLLLFALAVPLWAQPVLFTGNTDADFAGALRIADPRGRDVGMPSLLAANTSGWDIEAVAISYDLASDTLFVGIDTYGIAGDADGDGFPSMPSAALTTLGGRDRRAFGGTENVSFALDIDDDGQHDVIAGVPLGGDLSSWRLARFNGSRFAPHLAFGAPVPNVSSTVYMASPSGPTPSAPHIQFTISPMSELLIPAARGGQDFLGFRVSMGSFEDAGIGEDYLAGSTAGRIPTNQLPCVPIPARLTLDQVATLTSGPATGFCIARASLMVPDAYGCCIIASTQTNPTGVMIPALGNPMVYVGALNDPSSVYITDLGIAPATGLTANCKSVKWGFDPRVTPAGWTVHVQILAYPTVNSTMQTLFTSNVIDVTVL